MKTCLGAKLLKLWYLLTDLDDEKEKAAKIMILPNTISSVTG